MCARVLSEWQRLATESQDYWVRPELDCGVRSPGESRPGQAQAASRLSSLLSPASAPRAALPHALWTDIKVTWLLLSPGPHLTLVTDINIQPLAGRCVMTTLQSPVSAPGILSTWADLTDWLTLVLSGSGSDNVVQSLLWLQTEPRRGEITRNPPLVTRHQAVTGARWANTFISRIMWKECIYWFWFNICSNTLYKS